MEDYSFGPTVHKIADSSIATRPNWATLQRNYQKYLYLDTINFISLYLHSKTNDYGIGFHLTTSHTVKLKIPHQMAPKTRVF